MSHPTTPDWNSSDFQGHLSKVYNLPSRGVVDLTGCIRCGDFIAAGGSGQIFKGKWRKPIGSGSLSLEQHGLPNVAVKLVGIPALTDAKKKAKRFKRMKREVELWRQINHRNVLPLVGVARIDGDGNRLALISPWMEYGNVPDFLKQCPDFPAVSFLHDIIEGLHFLHTFRPEIIHGDIKAVNALVNYRKEAYLCDFGLSRFVVDNTLWRTTATHASGTLRWMAPELIEGETSTSTKASDVYAYGMTCYEILSGKVPFDTARTDATVMKKVLCGDRPERIISRHPDGLWTIITQCWTQDAEERPSTGEALRSLVQLIEGSEKLKEEMINIGKNIKTIVPYEGKASVAKSPSQPPPFPALHAPSRSIRDGSLSPLTPASAGPDTGRPDINPTVSVPEKTTLRKIGAGDAGDAEVKLAPALVPPMLLARIQRQIQQPSPLRVDTSDRLLRKSKEEEPKRGSEDQEKELQPTVEAKEMENLPIVIKRPTKQAATRRLNTTKPAIISPKVASPLLTPWTALRRSSPQKLFKVTNRIDTSGQRQEQQEGAKDRSPKELEQSHIKEQGRKVEIKERLRTALRLDAPLTNKNRPGPPVLSDFKSAPLSIALAQPIQDLGAVSYPEGILKPNPELNVGVKEGKFRYDRDFLLQFMPICRAKPESLPPLEVIYLGL